MSDRFLQADGDRYLLDHDDELTDVGEFVRVAVGGGYAAPRSGGEYQRRKRRPSNDGYDELDFA